MKSTTFAAALACLAGAVSASPIQAREEQAENGIFGGNGQNGIFGPGDNLVSNVFDGAACIVSSVLGGGNPRCQGKGTAAVKPAPGDDSSQLASRYTYKYETNPDSSLKVTITLQSGGSCMYNLKADGKDVKAVVADAAKKCTAVKK